MKCSFYWCFISWSYKAIIHFGWIRLVSDPLPSFPRTEEKSEVSSANWILQSFGLLFICFKKTFEKTKNIIFVTDVLFESPDTDFSNTAEAVRLYKHLKCTTSLHGFTSRDSESSRRRFLQLWMRWCGLTRRRSKFLAAFASTNGGKARWQWEKSQLDDKNDSTGIRCWIQQDCVILNI